MPSIDGKSSRLPLLLAAGLMASIPALAQQAGRPEPLVIQAQGSFTVGGTVTTAPTHHLARSFALEVGALPRRPREYHMSAFMKAHLTALTETA
jgi:hypothetical protein